MSKRALGKGIDALFRDFNVDKEAQNLVLLPLNRLKPNPLQPRTGFSERELHELADSIREKGVLQPLLVQEGSDETYTIIAGERRFRAAKIAGLMKIPALIGQFSEQDRLEVALIENLQREDLNPIEEARAFRKLMEIAGAKQEQVAERVGKNRSTVTNSLRLLKLPEKMQKAIGGGEVSSGHGRAILSLVNPSDRDILFERIVKDHLSVRQAEAIAQNLSGGGRGSRRAPSSARKISPELADVEQKLIDSLGTKVTIRGTVHRGALVISYLSMDELNRIASMLGFKEE